VARMGETGNAYIILIETPLGKCPLGELRKRWKDNYKMDIRDINCEDGGLMEMA